MVFWYILLQPTTIATEANGGSVRRIKHDHGILGWILFFWFSSWSWSLEKFILGTFRKAKSVLGTFRKAKSFKMRMRQSFSFQHLLDLFAIQHTFRCTVIQKDNVLTMNAVSTLTADFIFSNHIQICFIILEKSNREFILASWIFYKNRHFNFFEQYKEN